MAWLSGWTYRKEITVNNTGSELTNFQLKFTVNRSSGSDSGFTVYLDTKCESDYDDIRFTKADGSTLLDYWIESSSSSTATIWVEVDTITGTGDTTIYLYYGNSGASAVSDGDATFPFFDDFPGSSLDGSKWNSPGGGSVSINGGILQWDLGSSVRENSIVSKAGVSGDGYSIRSKCRYTTNINDRNTGISIRCNTNAKNQGIYCNSGSVIQLIETSVAAGTTIFSPSVQSTWYTLETTAIANTMYGRVNDGSWGSWDRAALTGNFGLHAANYATGTHTSQYDWVLIRKYTATEPTVSAWGSEEPIAKELIGKYSIFQSKELIGKYSILYTPKIIIGKYTIILTPVSKELIGKYQIWAGKPIVGKYGIFAPSELIGKYGISTSKSVIGKYTIFGSKGIIGKYSIFQSKELIGKYGISGGSSIVGRYRLDRWVHFTWIQKVEYITGASEITIGETLTGDTSGATGPVYMVAINSGNWSTGDAEGYLYVEAPTGLPFIPGEYLNGSISGDSCAIVADRDTVYFSEGDVEFTPGETVTGGTSGATADVVEVIVTSGTWAGGDAEGYIVVEDLEGEFVEGEDIGGSVSGPAVAVAGLPPTLLNVKTLSVSASRSIDQLGWSAQVVLDGIFTASQVANYRDTLIEMPDHTGTYQTLFCGFVPDYGVTQNPGENTTTVEVFSHDLYLLLQYVPDEYRSTLTWDPISETVTNIMPDVLVRDLLGGAVLWDSVTGIKPLYIEVSTDYGDSIPIKPWAWRPNTIKWQAIQDLADYLNFVYDTVWDGTVQGGRFCHIDDIDTYLGLPAAVTFTNPDDYVMSISKSTKGREKYNQIRVQGRRNTHIVYFDAGVTIFTAGHTVVDGGTGSEATLISCTKTAGAWDGTAEGYLIISYDRTGPFLNDNTIIDELGAAWGEATIDGNDEPYEQYDVYNYVYPATAPIRPREKFEELDESYDSTPLIEGRAVELYNFHVLDATPYTAVFRDRSDLRPWQKVKFVGYSGIPEEWMRIVSAQYKWFDGGDVRVTATLNNAAYITTQRKLYRSMVNTVKDQIEIIAQELIERFIGVDDAEVLKIEGEFGTLELKDGQIVVTGKGIE